MTQRVLFGVLFAIALSVAAFLPLCVERTMTHVMFAHPDAHGRGGTVEWGWKRCTFVDFCATYPHMSREQEPAVWLGLNIALMFLYAGVISFPLNALLKAFPRKKSKQHMA